MSTKKLAKELGLLRQHRQSSAAQKRTLLSNQIFSYLIVIDFESTCWREKNNLTQEIIEFPAVLLNTCTGEMESEFHAYVQPQERPTLSTFCTELTGITQMQVEAGVPLQICLSQFGRWLQKLRLEKGAVFAARQHSSSAQPPGQKLCAFLTWSDWDLGVCLRYECQRKQIHKPHVLNSWIDLRSTYRKFYDRKPQGLNGALQDVGIEFSGREHCGLDDARNTARLAARMMRDGCVMKITRSLERTPLAAKPALTENCPKAPAGPNRASHQTAINKTRSTEENTLQVPDSLQSRKTLVGGRTTPLWGVCKEGNGPLPCSSVVGGPQIPTSREEEFCVEDEDRSTYDDVVLEDDAEGALVSLDNAENREASKSKEAYPFNGNWERAPAPDVAIGVAALSTTGKVTSPLCHCGRRAKSLRVSNGGPNQGKGFYCCAGRRSGGGEETGPTQNKRCHFFQWESALKSRWSISTSHVRATRPPPKSMLRKSW
ncbi:ERI1 exoribonuclease 2 [Syngnathus scovelli]|uniref:ERI1 exoribonuclease 2 n=1 Tax=Syngnathus scovelli TaxID=161590 RepID=UPI0021105775|nr:ERI1 exoribonuclease 2 [Syngnathus scovelli]